MQGRMPLRCSPFFLGAARLRGAAFFFGWVSSSASSSTSDPLSSAAPGLKSLPLWGSSSLKSVGQAGGAGVGGHLHKPRTRTMAKQ